MPEGFAFKAAINRSWDENYGAGGVPQRRRHRVHRARRAGQRSSTTTGRTGSPGRARTPIVTAAGTFQSELGCAADWDPTCMRAWLQDPNDDDVYTLVTTEVPPGAYTAKATVGLSWDESYPASDVAFTVAEGEATRFRFDTSTNTFTVSTDRPRHRTPDRT